MSPDSDRAVDSYGHTYDGHSYDPGFQDEYPSEDHFSKAEERKLVARIDFRLIPVLSILYLLAFVDRTNIANAVVYGLTDDLGVAKGSNDYNTALTMLYVRKQVGMIFENNTK